MRKCLLTALWVSETTAAAAEAEPATLMVPCAACYNAFRLAEHEVREGGDRGRELNEEIAEIMGRPFGGTVTVKHPLEILGGRETAARLKGMVKRPLKGLKVACYYGCLLARPSKIVAFENGEHPMSMDNLMTTLGAEPVRWSYKTDCCGQSMAVAESGLVSELTNKIVRAAREAGAHALVTACPLCMMNLDSRQKAGAGEALLPVFFYTELAGLALEVGKPEAWFKRHLIDVKPALRVLEAKQSA
jgi:heterodisulfide reductase subunit B